MHMKFNRRTSSIERNCILATENGFHALCGLLTGVRGFGIEPAWTSFFQKNIEKLFNPPESVNSQAIIHLTSATLVTNQTRHTIQVFQVSRGAGFRVKATSPTGQYRSKAEIEMEFRDTVLFSCASQGFGDPVRRNRTPSLNESGRSLRNARRDFRRA
jgi:hypothetical protein